PLALRCGLPAIGKSSAAVTSAKTPEFLSVSYLHAAGPRLAYQWIRPPAQATARSPEAVPVLVFLHEGLGSVALWKDFPELVVEATGCSALVYSRYGYGKSDPLTQPRAVDYLHVEALEALPDVLDTLS